MGKPRELPLGGFHGFVTNAARTAQKARGFAMKRALPASGFLWKTHMSRRLRDILPNLPIVFGLPEPESAGAIGVSVSKFREMVADGRMPKPRRIDGRLVYDVDELRAAF
jgi:hypothetical protein